MTRFNIKFVAVAAKGTSTAGEEKKNQNPVNNSHFNLQKNYYFW